MKAKLLLRLVLRDPPRKVRFTIQDAQMRWIAANRESDDSIMFEFPVKVADAGVLPPRLTGAFTHGRPGSRFVHINAVALANQAGSQSVRRAKVPLGGISQDLIQAASGQQDCVLMAEIAGKSCDGGPCCATVQFLLPWQIGPR